MLPLIECQVEPHASVQSDPLLQELEEAALDPAQWPAIEGMLRALTRSVLDAATTLRFESIEPYELALEFVAGQLAGAAEGLDDELLDADHRYLLGRTDALLDACDMAIDRSISKAALEVARGSHVVPILDHLRQVGEARAGDLAHAVGIERNYLSNILKKLEEVGLVRRASVGRTTLVSLGPKAHAVHSALQAENHHGLQVKDIALAEPNPAQAELNDAMEPMAA